MLDRRWLRVAALLETATLVVLLTNRLTVHADPVTSLVGPLHGATYLVVIGCGLLVPLRRAARWWCVVPGLGGLLALRHPAPEESAAVASR
ncbi:MAG: hypothetical protein ACRCY8_02215 [Dermatophilaceae bacterium]